MNTIEYSTPFKSHVEVLSFAAKIAVNFVVRSCTFHILVETPRLRKAADEWLGKGALASLRFAQASDSKCVISGSLQYDAICTVTYNLYHYMI